MNEPLPEDNTKRLEKTISGFYSDITKRRCCNGRIRTGNGQSFYFADNHTVDIYQGSHKDTTASWKIVNDCVEVRDKSSCFPQNFNFTIEDSGLILRDRNKNILLSREY